MTTISDQRYFALSRANAARIDGAAVREELRRGRLNLEQALCDPRASSLTVEAVLRAVRRVGPRKASRILSHAGVADRGGRRVRELTPRQRAAIVEILQGADGWRR